MKFICGKCKKSISDTMLRASRKHPLGVAVCPDCNTTVARQPVNQGRLLFITVLMGIALFARDYTPTWSIAYFACLAAGIIAIIGGVQMHRQYQTLKQTEVAEV